MKIIQTTEQQQTLLLSRWTNYHMSNMKQCQMDENMYQGMTSHHLNNIKIEFLCTDDHQQTLKTEESE